MCVFCVSAKVLDVFCTSASRFLNIKDVRVAGNGFSSAILVACHRAGEHAQGLGSARLHMWIRGAAVNSGVCSATSMGLPTWPKVLKNEKRMIADLVERVEGGRLAEQDVLPCRTSWNKKNSTREVPYFIADENQIRTHALLAPLHKAMTDHRARTGGSFSRASGSAAATAV